MTGGLALALALGVILAESPGVVVPYKQDTWSASEAVKIERRLEGRYELRGDGVSTPYHWVWVPASGPPPSPVVSPQGTEPPAARPRH